MAPFFGSNTKHSKPPSSIPEYHSREANKRYYFRQTTPTLYNKWFIYNDQSTLCVPNANMGNCVWRSKGVISIRCMTKVERDICPFRDMLEIKCDPWNNYATFANLNNVTRESVDCYILAINRLIWVTLTFFL